MSTRAIQWLYGLVALGLEWIRQGHPRHDPPPTPAPLGTDLGFHRPLSRAEKFLKFFKIWGSTPIPYSPLGLEQLSKAQETVTTAGISRCGFMSWKGFFSPRVLCPPVVEYDLPLSADLLSKIPAGRISECPFCAEIIPEPSYRHPCFWCDETLDIGSDRTELGIVPEKGLSPEYQRPNLHVRKSDGRPAKYLVTVHTGMTINYSDCEPYQTIGVKMRDSETGPIWSNHCQVADKVLPNDDVENVVEMLTKSIFDGYDVDRTRKLEAHLPRGVMYV